MLLSYETLQKPYKRFGSRLIHPIRNSVEVVFEQVSVRVEGHRGRGMSEHSLDRFGVGSGTDRDASRSVPEVMGSELGKRFIRETGRSHRRPEPTHAALWSDLMHESISKDELVTRFSLALVGEHVDARTASQRPGLGDDRRL